MLIKRLEVKGFKSLRDVVWEPGPLTVVIGPNGSGKTNLLGALELLPISTKGQLQDHITKNGSIKTLLWDGSADCIDLSMLADFSMHLKPSSEIYFEYGFSLESLLSGSSYWIIEEWLNRITSLSIGAKHYKHINKDHSETEIYDIESIAIDPQQFSKELQTETILSHFSSPFINTFYIKAANEIISRCSIFPCITTNKNSEVRRPRVSRYDLRMDPDGQNLVNVLHTLYSENRDFENDINTAMRAAFGDDFDRLVFPPAADQLVQLRIRWKSLKREQSMFDLSDGTIRFLFLMTVLCNPNPPPLIAIDEPETGLHPSMFPIIAEYADEASKRTQVIFSTHSPQFLDAFSDFAVTTTVTNWRDGETTVKNLDGEALKKWLQHYSLGSLFLSGDLEALT